MIKLVYATSAWLPVVKSSLKSIFSIRVVECSTVSFARNAYVDDDAFSCDPVRAKSISVKRKPELRAPIFKPHPFEFNAVVELKIEDITNLGFGVGRVALPNGSKWVVFVPFVLPGEVVTAKVLNNFATYSEAELVEVLEPSKDRVVPQCKYFSICGGCQYQHMSIESQRMWKRQQVATAITRIGGMGNVDVNEVVGTDNIYGYRTKLTPHHLSFNGEHPPAIGFRSRLSNEMEDIEECVIATPNINQRYKMLREEVITNLLINHGDGKKKKGNHGASLLLREVDDGYVETDCNAMVCETVNGIKFKFKVSEFFQNNRFALPLLVNHVVKMASMSNCDFLIDAYCGSGLFALSASPHFKSVFGVEVSRLAVKAAVENAALNNITNTEFTIGNSEKIFQQVDHLDNDRTVIVLDPPRKGCDPFFLQQLLQFRPRSIVYVSCDPATQARDARSMVKHGYQVVDATPFDLFPQTRHIENVLTLTRE